MTGVELIAAERQRQIDVEGFTAAHDNTCEHGELGAAAECYVAFAVDQSAFGFGMSKNSPPMQWPWDATWWKPSEDKLRNLAKAGALIAAEIDRILRID